MLTKAMVLAMGCGALLAGCGVAPEAVEEAQEVDQTQEIIDNLVEAGFQADDILVVDDLVYVGRDAVVTLQASREMLAHSQRGGQEQYSTGNLVHPTITNVCINGAAFTGVFSTALNFAIANYNARGLQFTMTRTTGSTAGCGAVITANISGGTGGSAGFPEFGLPFGTINIGAGLATFDVNTIEHVITHELGHCIGLRHSDFFNRSISCGVGGNEGPATVGAFHLPGTPTGAAVGGSIMNSCFRTLENGEFTASDITALNFLY